jgi:hypothetical protein
VAFSVRSTDGMMAIDDPAGAVDPTRLPAATLRDGRIPARAWL